MPLKFKMPIPRLRDRLYVKGNSSTIQNPEKFD